MTTSIITTAPVEIRDERCLSEEARDEFIVVVSSPASGAQRSDLAAGIENQVCWRGSGQPILMHRNG